MASNIKVALTLDDKDYQTKLKAADTATKSFGSNAATALTAASHGFEKLGTMAEGVKSKMEGLGAAIAGIGMTEYIHRALESAAATKDLSEAFGINIATVKELEMGFSTAGRNSEAMSRTLYTLAGSVESLKDGVPGTIDNFNKLGLNFEKIKGLDTKEIMLEIAKAMEKAGGSTESITAAVAILGKSAKGMPWGDFIAGTEKATGTMNENALAVESLDKTMKMLEAKSRDLMTAFQTLIKPIADAFNEFMDGSNNADAAAKVLLASMAVFGAGAIVVGINAVVSAIAGLATTFGLSAGATVVETGLLAANTVGLVENTAVRAAGLTAKVASLESSLANARAVLAETAAEEASVLVSAELTAARRVLMIQTSQLASAEALLADATATGAAAAGTLAVAEGGAIVATGGLATAMGALMTTMAPLIAIIGAAGLLWMIYKQNAESAKITTENMLGAMDESSFAAAIANAKEMASQVDAIGNNANKTEETFKRLGITASKIQGGRGTTGTDPNKPNSPLLATDDRQKNQSAAAEESLRAQGRLREFNLGLDMSRLALAKEMIGLSDSEKAIKQSAYDFEIKKLQEVTRLTDEIARMTAQQANDPSGGVAYAGQLKILQNQLVAVKNQKDTLTPLVTLNQDLLFIESIRVKEQQNMVKALDDQFNRQIKLSDTLRGLKDQKIEFDIAGGKRGKSPLEQQIMDIQEAARKGAQDAGRAFTSTFDNFNTTEEDAVAMVKGLDEIAAAYKEIADAQISALGVSKDFATGNIDAIGAIQEQIKSGLISAWDDYKTKALDTAGQIKDSFGNFTQGMEDAFVKFVQTGKLSFSDLANSIVADLARIAFKKAVIGIGSLFGFAAGGDVMGNTPIIVGERGPELFVPSTAGKIIPNNQLGTGQGSSAGGQTVVNYNIQAVDASSFRSLVARDPSFIFAVTEQGRRSQPTRRAF